MKLVSVAFAVSAFAAAAAIQAATSQEAIQQACQSELQSLCPGKTGQDAMNCLKAAGSDKVSANCKNAIEGADKTRKRK